MIKKIFLLILFFFAVLLRFYNLGTSARFIWDESIDLVNLKHLADHPKITLIGPISEDRIKVFSSLYYYLVLPFTIIFGFNPTSPVYAAAIFGILTIILLYLTKKIPFLILFLSVISFPLVESSRWAWHPHLIPFWQSLSLLVHPLLGGLFLGLTIHHHYYAIFPIVGYFLINRKKFLFYILGFFFALVPFIIFDLTHPPGLFITRMLFFSPVSTSQGAFNLSLFIPKIISNTLLFFDYLSGHQKYFSYLTLFFTFLILILQRNSRLQFLPIITMILGLSIISGNTSTHYLLAGVIFYLLYLSSNYRNSILAKLTVFILIISNLIALPNLIFKNDWSTNINAVKHITQIIYQNQKDRLSPFNLVVLQSPDPNTKGRRFRDLLSLQNLNPLPLDNYRDNRILYVISYAPWQKVQQDPAYEIDPFRHLSPTETYKISNSQWIIYRLLKL